MYPEVRLLEHSIPTYWLCALAGGMACVIAAVFRHKKFEELQEVDITNSAALALIGAVLGGRVLSAATLLPLIIKHRALFFSERALLFEALSNGLVFYGGLFGALAILAAYTKKYRLNRTVFFDYAAPLIPLFHCFGRLGCLLTGCCHGIPSERFGIAFTHSASAPNGVAFFPIQLVCSLGNLALFLFLLRYEKRHHREGKCLKMYLLLYAIGRFVVEFFRGDEIRGLVFGVSTSQWISLGVLFVLLTKQFRTSDKSEKEACP